MTSEKEIYRARFTEEDLKEKNEVWRVLCAHWFPRFIPESSVVLDLGGGACEFINNIQCKSRFVIDRNPDVRRFAGDHVTCIVDELLEGLRQLPGESVDRILASNVFEHLPNKEYLFAVLAEAHRVLAPEGQILVMQPNIRAVKESFYDFADHSLPLTEKGMKEALVSNAFEVTYMKARFLPYTTQSRFPRWPILVRAYLKLPILHRLLGGQMMIAAVKRAKDPSE